MNIYIGYDPDQEIAYKTCVASIFRNTKSPQYYSSFPLIQEKLRESGLYWREIDEKASTPFSLTRFLVPALNGYKGWAIYCDSDFMFLDDITNLFALKDDTKAVQCVFHPPYKPKNKIKMHGVENHIYPKKNWSSLMLFNCEHDACKQLTPEVVNSLSPAALHQFDWCYENELGQLPAKWNHLIGYCSDRIHPSAIHYTDGGPWMKGYEDVPYATIWREYSDSIK